MMYIVIYSPYLNKQDTVVHYKMDNSVLIVIVVTVNILFTFFLNLILVVFVILE